MTEDYKVETFIQTLSSGKKRIVVTLFKIERKLLMRHFIDIKPEEFYH